MAKAVDEICASCGKSQPKKGSLTQWIGLTDCCRCAVFGDNQARNIPAQDVNTTDNSRDSVCQECGKHLKRSTGSLTQWVFRQDMCDCSKRKLNAQNAVRTTSSDELELVSDKDTDLLPVDTNGSNIAHQVEEHTAEQPVEQAVEQPEEQTAEPAIEQVKKAPGQVIARHYEVISCLGEGGTSLVYKAKHQFMERTAAIKVLSPDRIPDAKTIQRFQQEARSVSRLKHPNIIDVHEFGVDENKQPYLIMDYLEGNSLFAVIEKDGPMQPSRAAALFMQMADALQHAHEKGVIHRDLKPTNAILVKDTNGHEQVKLVDFGIAKLSEPEDKEKALTQTGEIFGSPFYMSPEQCKGLKLDHRSDIYSFGCLMYEMVIGEPAAKSGSVVETLMLHINGLTLDFDNQPIVKKYAQNAKDSDSFEAAHEQKCMARLRQIIQGCTKKEPSDRYKSMGDIKRDLERLLAGNKPLGGKESAYTWTALEQGNKPAEANGTAKAAFEVLPVIIVIGGFILCLGAALLIYDPLQLVSKNRPAQEATSVPMPKFATHVLVATKANGDSDPIVELSPQTVSNLEKDQVVTIRMRNTQVGDEDFRLLSTISTLETLDITGSSGFKQDSIKELSKLPKLKTLILAGTDVSDKSSMILQTMPIERLDLCYTRFTDRGIENLMSSKTLRFLKPYKSLVTKEADQILAKHGWKRALRDWYEK
jgi:serine/threonine protein kinase